MMSNREFGRRLREALKWVDEYKAHEAQQSRRFATIENIIRFLEAEWHEQRTGVRPIPRGNGKEHH